jgi:Tetratricopeptide repeat
MFDRMATTVARGVFLVLLATLPSACAATRPTPPLVAPPTSLPPPVLRIPGEPVALTPAEKALGHFFKAEVAANQGDQDTALTELEQAVANDSDSPFLQLRLATLYVRKGKLAEALEHCQKAVAQEPENTEAQLLLAGLLSSTDREEEAAAVYEAVLARSPKDQEPYLYLGTLYAKQGNFDKATAVLNARGRFWDITILVECTRRLTSSIRQKPITRKPFPSILNPSLCSSTSPSSTKCRKSLSEQWKFIRRPWP